jgi:hypothetical protein
MTNKEINARRKQLEEQLANVYRAYNRAGGEQQRANNEAHAATAAINRARIAKVRGEPDADVDAAVAAAREAGERSEQVKAESEAAYQARKEVEEELDTFLATHFEVFAEAAVKRSEAAEEALQIVLRAILRAENLWREADAAWKPLCKATKIGGVPAFPLSRVAASPARPPSIHMDAAA